MFTEPLIQKLNKIKEDMESGDVKHDGAFVFHGEKFGGALSVLAEKFYKKNFKPVEKRRGKFTSSKKSGEVLHRQIYHKYKCNSNPKTCTCKSRFGVKSKAPKEGSHISNMLKSFDSFIKDNKIFVYDCEVIVKWEIAGCASSIDVLCVNSLSAPTKACVVEIKTGYSAIRHKQRTIDGTGMMIGEAGKDIKNTYANHHQLQLWFCINALRETYDISASKLDSCVLYLHPKHKYKSERSASWWSEDKEMKEKLQKQIK